MGIAVRIARAAYFPEGMIRAPCRPFTNPRQQREDQSELALLLQACPIRFV